MSAFNQTLTATVAVVETRQLDFNLARRSAIIVNQVIGQMFLMTNTTSGHGVAMHTIQELDTDPDNINTEFGGSLEPEAVVLDSSRPFRQVIHGERDTAAGVQNPFHTIMKKDWTAESETKRPISITALRHHVSMLSDINAKVFAEIHIDYFIVELTLEEIGIINASRR